MIAVPILLSTLLAQAAPPAIDLSGLRAGLRAMREDLSGMQLDEESGDESSFVAFANPQDDDGDDDDDDQEMRDRAREEREGQKERVREQRERAREQAQEARERAQEQAERARERAQQQAERARERAQEQAERLREKQDKFREKQEIAIYPTAEELKTRKKTKPTNYKLDIQAVPRLSMFAQSKPFAHGKPPSLNVAPPTAKYRRRWRL